MKDILTTFQVAKMCKVDITSVINWIEAGKIVAYKTPGGHRRIKREDLLVFLKAYNMPIPDEVNDSKQVLALIVDDEKEIRDFIKGIIEKKWPSAAIVEAEDGFSAGKLLAEKKPSIVILDIKLPGIDGIQVCKIIKKDTRLKNTKILAITGYMSAEVKENVLNAGADSFLTKPLSVNSITEKISELLKI